MNSVTTNLKSKKRFNSIGSGKENSTFSFKESSKGIKIQLWLLGSVLGREIQHHWFRRTLNLATVWLTNTKNLS